MPSTNSNHPPHPSSAQDDQSSSRWTLLCEAVFLPIGSLFAIFLVMLSLMLITTR